MVGLSGFGCGHSEAANDGCDTLYYPRGVHYFERINEFRENPSSGRIMLLGDSITERWPVKMVPQEEINRGIDYNTICGVVYEIPLHVVDEAPTAVIIAVGTNDAARATDPFIFYLEYVNAIHMIQRALPDTRIYARSILPRGTAGGTLMVEAYNRWIKSAAEYTGATYLDTFPYLICGASICEEYTVDGVHLSESGYEQMRAHFWEE
jgi:hypothetical protein